MVKIRGAPRLFLITYEIVIECCIVFAAAWQKPRAHYREKPGMMPATLNRKKWLKIVNPKYPDEVMEIMKRF